VREKPAARITPHQKQAGRIGRKPYIWLDRRKIGRCIISEGSK
jgi:antitoxin (DNA-binding transcriptional repressor) of toxin-antitoxin stability system